MGLSSGKRVTQHTNTFKNDFQLTWVSLVAYHTIKFGTLFSIKYNIFEKDRERGKLIYIAKNGKKIEENCLSDARYLDKYAVPCMSFNQVSTYECCTEEEVHKNSIYFTLLWVMRTRQYINVCIT